MTIGAFDGVHRGHQAVVGRLRSLADDGGCSPAVVTFDRHPAAVVRPESAPKLLTDLDQKLEILASIGIDYTVVVHFDHQRSQEEPQDFVREVLVDALGARIVVVGENFHFGRQRHGNVALLQAMGATFGFEVASLGLVGSRAPGHEVSPSATEPVSSTAIRQCLASGQVGEAAALLGRPHEVRGVVERGDRRGHQLGFPTANVAVPEDILLPAPGIYAGWYARPPGPTRHAAAISVGRRPTFHEHPAAPLVLEAYLLDFDGGLYGEEARVRFVSRLREEERFGSTDALLAQMALDVEATRAALAGASLD